MLNTTPNNSGILLSHNHERYEFIQELFYAIVRALPSNERVAVIYNYTGKPAVEMVDAGISADPSLQTHLIFVTALLESGVLRKGSVFGRVFKQVVPGKKQA